MIWIVKIKMHGIIISISPLITHYENMITIDDATPIVMSVFKLQLAISASRASLS